MAVVLTPTARPAGSRRGRAAPPNTAGRAATPPCRATPASTTTTTTAPTPLPIVILPGLGNAASDYAGLAAGLASRGAPAVVTAPVARPDWLRNAAGLARPEYWRGTLTPRPTVDWYLEAIEKAVADARGAAGLDGRVALVAHSAGGWLARTWLLGGGCASTASLTTLGSPHAPPPPDSGLPDQTRGILTWIEANSPGAFHGDVAYTTVASRYLKGAPLFGGSGGGSGNGGGPSSSSSPSLAARLAGAGYASLCGRPDVWGDAITPVETAHLAGAAQVTLDGIFHGPLGASPDPEEGAVVEGVSVSGQRYWYGSAPVIDRWAVAALGLTPLGGNLLPAGREV
jgi:hypothetical protein